MAIWLFSKVVALYVDNSTANTYLCNQDDTTSHFLCRLACCILNLADKQHITLIPKYISTHLNVEADYLFKVGWFLSGTYFLAWLRLTFFFRINWRRNYWYHHVLINVSAATHWKVPCCWKSWG